MAAESPCALAIQVLTSSKHLFTASEEREPPADAALVVADVVAALVEVTSVVGAAVVATAKLALLELLCTGAAAAEDELIGAGAAIDEAETGERDVAEVVAALDVVAAAVEVVAALEVVAGAAELALTEDALPEELPEEEP